MEPTGHFKNTIRKKQYSIKEMRTKEKENQRKQETWKREARKGKMK
jgi:hypothetical protein